MLRRCLVSIRDGTVRPAEILLLDQSPHDGLVSSIGAVGLPEVRSVRCQGVGIARNVNLGLRESAHDNMLMTHDDCVVAPDWVEVMSAAIGNLPNGMTTGRVLPPDDADPQAVPSIKTWEEPEDFTGRVVHGALYPNNMAVHRHTALDLGGFDERDGFRTAAEDLDFCYRWLTAGHALRYEPRAVVTHVDWREPEALVKLYQNYAKSAGRFYGKYLLKGDRRIARWALRDMANGMRAWRRYRNESFPRWHEQQLELPVHLPIGIAQGIAESIRLRVTSNA